jgi:hypothetical protein
MHPPQFDERSLILPVVHLQAGAVSFFDGCSDGGIDEQASVQRYGYSVTDLEWVLMIWLFAGWHGKQFSPD